MSSALGTVAAISPASGDSRLASGVTAWSSEEQAAPSVATPPKTLSLGPLAVDLVAHRVTVNGDRVRVTAMQMRLLVYLLEHRDQVVTRVDLLKQVWGYQGDVQTRTVDIHVQRLRERLGCAADLIGTVRGIGYRLSEDRD